MIVPPAGTVIVPNVVFVAGGFAPLVIGLAVSVRAVPIAVGVQFCR